MIIKAILRSKPVRISAAILIALLFVNGCRKPDMESYLDALEEGKFQESEGESESASEEESESEVAPFLDFKETESISDGCYEYSMLGDDDRTIYNEILTTIMNHDSNVAIQTRSPEKLDDVFNRVLADHGELFWVSGYSYTEYTIGGMVVGIEFTPGYSMTKTERDSIQEQIDSAVSGYTDAVPAEADDYTKLKILYTLLASNVTYDKNAKDNQTIVSVFLNRSTVCQGFANALQYLATKCGIQSIVVTGMGMEELHAWNMINIEGSFYHVDVTWANTTFTDTETENSASIINYSYLCMTDSDISADYTITSTFDIPIAEDTTYTYFVHENRCFDTFDEGILGSVLNEAVTNQDESVSLKFMTQEAYDAAVNYLLVEFHIKDFCPDMTKAYYYEDLDKLILTIRLL
ncbi:MAG: hypothetical protein K6E13_00280 [Lachnospiraceae bacterium]|nr:hypothetical protein [Lachnospiraceae bacterium]